ncbi:MAG: FliH/SctL family protein [Desulfobulbaceae bacterium]|nr:FliH/SctL family protein [Desulfobulbaceae bacterium]
MNSSRVIKSSLGGSGNAIFITRPGGGESGGGGFHSLASLWQSDDAELVSALSTLEEEKKLLQQAVEATKAETEEMLAAAQERVAQIEKDAFDKGFAAGKAECLAQEQAKFAQIDTLLAEIEQDRKKLYAQYETDILSLVKAMVDRVLFHEVTINPKAIEVCLKTALAYVVENSSLVIRLHAQDLVRLKQVAMERPELLAGYKKIELVEDPSIALGGCHIDTGFGEIDASLESRKEKVFLAIDAVLHKAVSAAK